MEDFRAARRCFHSAFRSLAKVARIATALLFLPLLLLFLKMADPGPMVWEALKGRGRTVFVMIVIVSLVASVDSFLSIVASYRGLSGFRLGPSLLFAAGSLNIVMACHWFLSPPLVP
ncbi:MAG: hypothetical protein ABR951_07340 [Candidatus Aminicenantales bacterium]|jgi:hypothetical protein